MRIILSFSGLALGAVLRSTFLQPVAQTDCVLLLFLFFFFVAIQFMCKVLLFLFFYLIRFVFIVHDIVEYVYFDGKCVNRRQKLKKKKTEEK